MLKGGVRVKHAGRCVSLALFALLLLCSHMVEGPAVPLQAEESAPQPASVMLSRMNMAPGEQPCPVQAESRGPRPFFHETGGQKEDAACVRVADRNGHPLSSRAYVRTVYMAFPPEHMPG